MNQALPTSNLILLSIRTLYLFSLGKAIRIIYNIFLLLSPQLADVGMWLCILFVFVTSYGVFRQALFFGNKQLSWNMIEEVFYKPYWHIHGELFAARNSGSFFFICCRIAKLIFPYLSFCILSLSLSLFWRMVRCNQNKRLTFFY